MANIYSPGEGFYAGIHAFFRGQKSSENTFLQNIPQKTEPRYTTEIEFSVEKGKIGVAGEIGYQGVPQLVTEEHYKREVYCFPLFAEYMRITGHELLKRPPTKAPNAAWSREEAQAYWVERKMAEMYSRIQCRREYMMAQLLLEGKLKFSRTENVDLKRDAKLTKTINAGKKWDDAARGHDPLKDISEMCILISQTSGTKPKGLLMDGLSYEMMRSSVRFIETASTTFSDIHLGNKPNQENGAVLMGTLMAGGCVLDVWIYDGIYEDEKNQIKVPFIPEKKVIIGDFRPDNSKVKWYFGATNALQSHVDLAETLSLSIDEILDDISGGLVVPTHWVDRDSLEVGLQSAMLCLPSDINMYGVLTVA